VSLSEVTGEEEWIVTLADYNIGLFSIGIADIHSDSEDLSSLVTILVFAARVIITLRVSQGFQGRIWMILLLMLSIGLN
jgi:hypothetical protein